MKRRNSRPEMLPAPAMIYAGGRYPVYLRSCFEDGSTKIYELRDEQPGYRKAMDLIKKMKEEIKNARK